MTCKDCIHCDVCSDWENICNKMSLFSTIKKEVCKDFKDKSKIIELPCKVGDMVYIIATISCTITHTKVIGIWSYKGNTTIITELGGIQPDAWGKTVFLTREEAEQALRDGKENGV